MPAKTPLASNKIDATAACGVPFHPYCGGVVTRTQDVSEYMLVLALCLVIIIIRLLLLLLLWLSAKELNSHSMRTDGY